MSCPQQVATWQQRFAAMLPVIVNYLLPAFRELPPEAKAEAIQEGVANSCIAYARLVERGKESLAFATVLARYAIAQARSGRHVGGHLNSNDISSPYAQRKRNLRLGRLDRYVPQEACWKEVLVEDERTPILDQVCFRIDFPAWLETLPERDQEIAQSLAEGESTTQVARRFGLSLGRVSQLRRQFERSWLAFVGEQEQAELLAAA